MKIAPIVQCLLCFLLMSTSTSKSFAATLLIEVGDPGTSSTGVWRNATGASMPLGTNRGLYAVVGGGIETYRFETRLPETAEYTLQIYNTCYSPRSSQVTQFFDSSQGRHTFITDQDCQSDPFVGQWRTLGQFTLQADEEVIFTLTSEGSNQSYVGITAIRYLYNESPEPPEEDSPPMLSVSESQLSLLPGETFVLTATATDVEDGDISAQIQWQSPVQSSTGRQFEALASDQSFSISVSVTDSAGQRVTLDIPVEVRTPENNVRRFDFGCTISTLNPLNLNTYNASALPDVGAMCDRYTAQVLNNESNQTLFYHQDQGRLDGVVARFPLDAVLRNVGIAPINQPLDAKVSEQAAYLFSGLQIHHRDFNSVNSAHLVVGQRGTTRNTIEGKTTLNGRSQVNDIGANQLRNGRADIRLQIDAEGRVTAYWQEPNLIGDPAKDAWVPYRGTGVLPGGHPDWGEGRQVIVGIITYAYYSNGLPFWGVADRLEIIEH